MRLKTIFLSCALFAILIAQLPTGEAVTCEEDPNDDDCVDCEDPINAEDAECVAEEDEDTTTELTTAEPGDDTGSTTRRTRPTRRPRRRPGWRRPGWWRRRRTTTARPRTILGQILQKKIDFLNRVSQPRPRRLG